MSLVTKNKAEGHVDYREITTPEPECITADNLSDLVSALGEEVVLDYAKRQLIIAFRSNLRSMLAAKDDNGDWVNSDEYFASADFEASCLEWVPAQRTRKTDAEKAQEVISKLAANGMSPEDIQAVIQAAMAAQGE